MIRLIETLGFRCLKYVSQPLGDFHVLVGPNASGKTTFLDIIAFMGKLVSDGLEEALNERTPDFRDLVWQRRDGCFELALELGIPLGKRELLEKKTFNVVRYEISVGLDQNTKAVSLLAEKVLLKEQVPAPPLSRQLALFPVERPAPETLITPKGTRHTKTVVNKVIDGNDNFYDETGKGWDHSFKLGPRKSAFGNLPEDKSKFPVATWLKGILREGIQAIMLNSALMCKPSPPAQPRGFRPDGSNLPWVVEFLKNNHPERHREWLNHLQTALPDLEDIRTIERKEDHHRYLVVDYQNNIKVPSWMISDGTLRLLALTLPAYLPDLEGIYLIEEPENGIHPRAVETMFQSLSSVYGAQMLMATHSPVILSAAQASQVLCFSKTEKGAADIVLGSKHPALRDWKGEENLGVLFAGGVLG